ncbi:uncharacterized protein PRCAT00005676001 [Priceomyces carsonii]|uniref:uncharacterized protein n=1 Tax=Priceomyces carsonii TaxID=28549 RepID=UPI002EDAF441|nr:unnamed protein product [Priceomyces carsonii]
MSMSYSFPKIHSFPPLYTKQPNATIFSNQLDSWCDIILSYCEHFKVQSLSSNGIPLHAQDETTNKTEYPLIFENKGIGRAANEELKQAVFKHLIHKLCKADYIDPKHPDLGIVIYWKSLAEWSNLLYNYVDSAGLRGTILTVYELTKLEESLVPSQLRNLDPNLLIKIIKEVLVKQGKAQILVDDTNNEIGGVKIV